MGKNVIPSWIIHRPLPKVFYQISTQSEKHCVDGRMDGHRDRFNEVDSVGVDLKTTLDERLRAIVWENATECPSHRWQSEWPVNSHLY